MLRKYLKIASETLSQVQTIVMGFLVLVSIIISSYSLGQKIQTSENRITALERGFTASNVQIFNDRTEFSAFLSWFRDYECSLLNEERQDLKLPTHDYAEVQYQRICIQKLPFTTLVDYEGVFNEQPPKKY